MIKPLKKATLNNNFFKELILIWLNQETVTLKDLLKIILS
jgi:hypothetical protein